MTELSFKNAVYRLYAPYRFEMTKWIATKYFKSTGYDTTEASSLLWDRFLAKKFLCESKRIGGTPTATVPWKKQSDILFILGCGSSINNISPTEWNLIAKNDSIGVNYFFFHQFKPSAHFIELGKSKEAFEAIHQLLLNDAQRTEPVFMQIRHLINNEISLRCARERVNLYSPTTMKTRNYHLLKDYLKRFYSPRSSSSPLIHHSSTLDCVINFAVRQQYKKICLLGVDLIDNSYFWDTAPLNTRYSRAIKAVDADYEISNWDRDFKKQHVTVNRQLASSLNCLSLLEYLDLLKDTEFKHHNLELVVGNEFSLLTKLFRYQSISDVTRTIK